MVMNKDLKNIPILTSQKSKRSQKVKGFECLEISKVIFEYILTSGEVGAEKAAAQQ